MEHTYLTMDGIHAVCLDMLRAVDEVCRAENIQYFLSGGTLLGAVRHQGFIPWDDDVDLMMPRPEYERFLKIAAKRLPPRYELAFADRTEEYAFPWIRICDRFTAVDDSGMQNARTRTLFIDVFPIDGLPANPRASELFFRKIRAYDVLLKCARKKALYPDERLKWLKRPLMALTRLRRLPKSALSLDRAARRRSFSRAKYAGVCVVTHYGSRERMPAEVFRGAVNVTFEGLTVPEPLLNGNHAHIVDWQLSESLYITLRRRPEMAKAYLDGRKFTRHQQQVVDAVFDRIREEDEAAKAQTEEQP